jgi:hypothetical protein
MSEFLINFSFLVFLLSTLSFLYYQLKAYQRIFKRSFSFLNEFPYELLYLKQRFMDTYAFMFLCVSGISFYSWMYLTFFDPRFITHFVWMIVLTMTTIGFVLIFLVQPKKVEPFLFTSIIFFSMSSILYFLMTMLLVQSPFNYWNTFLTISTLIQGILQLTIIFHPKLSQWATLEKVSDNEKPLYERPRIFPLALMQWLVLLNLVILVILMRIELLI